MDLVVKRKSASVFASGLLAAVLSTAPVRADGDMLFGQPAPQQFLLNKMLNPQSSQHAGGNGQTAGSANGQASGGNGQVAAGEAAEADEDGPGPYPKRYLLNKLFDANK